MIPSPNKRSINKNERLLDWVEKSSMGLLPHVPSVSELTCSKKQMSKRKAYQDENLNQDIRGGEKKLRRCKTPAPTGPQKFYLPVHCGLSSDKVFALPSTPESKQSVASSCVSPEKLDGVFVSRRCTSDVSNTMLHSDTDSSPSTPAKTPLVHKLSCGLDSPETDDAPSTVEKKFSKLGHRLRNRTPLQLFQESIRSNTKKVRGLRSGKHDSRTKLSVSQEIHVSPHTKQTVHVSPPTKQNVHVSPHTAQNGHIVSPHTSQAVNMSPHATQNVLNSPSPKQEVKLSPQTCSDHSSSASSTKRVVTENEMDRFDNTLEAESSTLVQKKLLPLFQRQSADNNKDREQLVIDAGQRSLDEARQCSVCRMIYSSGNPDDETLHRQFHFRLLQALRFPGWKKENVTERGDGYRIIYIDYNSPPHCHKKIQALKVILDQELGFVQEENMIKPNRKIYLYVTDDKQIKGVCIAESISKANRLEGNKASKESVRAGAGINRLWVYAKYRRQGVATALLNSVRSTFSMGVCIGKEDVAFSDPTSHGKQFATRYTGTSKFLIYKP